MPQALPQATEFWAAVPGFPNYEVSTLGRIRTKRRARVRGGFLKPFLRAGYPSVFLLGDSGKANILVHRLVLMVFRPREDADTLQAAHLNGDKADARLANLCWATKAENEAHKRLHGTALFCENTPSAKLSNEQVREIKRLYRKEPQALLAARFGVSRSCIQRIHEGRTWKSLSN